MCDGTYILSFDGPSTENFKTKGAEPIIDMAFSKFFKYRLLSYMISGLILGNVYFSVNPKYIVLPILISTMYC